MKKIRVLLADDHQLMRSGVRLMLEREPDVSVVGEASDGREAVTQAKTLKPDVVIMDIGMAGLNGIEAARQMTQERAELAVMILSMHADETYVLRALRAGARGYLLKDSAEAELIKAVHVVAGGKSFFSPAVSKVLLDDYVRKLKRSGTDDPYDLLTPREREILQLIAEGKSNKDIANLLNLSVYTVESHRSNLMEKLNVRGLPELILYAVRKGIIT
jgi:two-component system, NarL family, response regulator NreC